MRGEKPVDVLLVRSLPLPQTSFSSSLSICFVPPASPTAAKRRELQVAHGLILRCFWKRWLSLSVDDPLRMMLAPGAIAVLRYVISDKIGLW
jgi:hypothetical protein